MSQSKSQSLEGFREERDKIKNIIEDSHIPFIELSLSGKILQANSPFQSLFDYTAKELYLKNIKDLLAEPKNFHVLKNNTRKFGWIKDYEVNFKTNESHMITGLLSLALKQSESGKVVGYQGILHDITERKLRENTLKNISNEVAAYIGNDFFYSLVKSLTKYLDVRYAIIGELKNHNTKKIKTLAVCSEAKIVKNFEYELSCKSFRETCDNQLCHLSGQFLKKLSPDTMLKKSGIKIHICIPLYDSNQNPLGVLTVLDTKPLKNREIAESMLKMFGVRVSAELERERAKSARLEMEEKYRLVVQNATDAILLMENAKIKFFNPKTLELTGYQEKHLINKNFFDLVDINDKSRVAYCLSKLAKYENYTLESFQLIDKGGDARWVEGNFLRVNWHETTSCLLFLNDITKRKALQEELAQAQRLESAGRVAGQIAHDFNNLLSPITAYPALIREEIPENKSCLEMLNEIEQAANKLAQINQQLLALGRRGHYTTEKVDLKELLLSILLSYKLHQSIKLKKFFRSDLYMVKGGATQLRRAFLNIIQNAVEAMDDSGTLKVSARNVTIKKSLKGYYSVNHGNYVRIDIKDTGHGMPPEIRKRIFEPFFTTKKRDKKRGSGLGLSIVYSIIEAHNAYLTVDSEEGKGTIFSIYLPALKRARRPVHKTSRKKIRGDENILIVDDDPVQRKVTSQLLKRLGYNVHVLSTGEGAIRHFKRNTYDLVIMDMIMNGIDGLETYRKILEIQPNQRAIIVSGYAMSNKVKQAQKLGVGGFVSKPITSRTLAEAVRHELDKKVVQHSLN